MSKTKVTETSEKEVKTFANLKEDVVDSGLCCACGACISYCESQNFDVIEMKDYTPQFKSEKSEENCTECGLCYFICPQTQPIMEQIETFYDAKGEVGHYENILAGKTTDEQIEKIGQDGGVVTTILRYLFDKNKIDGAVVSTYNEKLEPIPKLVFKKEELLDSAGTRYSISSQLLPLKDIYSLPLEVIKEKGIYDINSMRLAFVGTPCQLRAIRKMHFLSVTPVHTVKYVISLFCFENFNYEKLYKTLKDETNLSPDEINKTYIKKNFFVKSKNEKKYEVNIKKLDSAVRTHCHECDEFTGKYSDISVGSSGAPEGYSMIIIRTEKGQKVIKSMIENRYIEQLIVPPDQTKEWKEKKVKLFKRMINLKHK